MHDPAHMYIPTHDDIDSFAACRIQHWVATKPLIVELSLTPVRMYVMRYTQYTMLVRHRVHNVMLKPSCQCCEEFTIKEKHYI